MNNMKEWLIRKNVWERMKSLSLSAVAGFFAFSGYTVLFDREDKPRMPWTEGELWFALLFLIFGSAWAICGLIGTMRGWDAEETGNAGAKLALTVIIGLSVLVGLLFIYPALARFFEDTPAWAVTIIILAVIIIILLVGIHNSLTRRKE